MHLDIIQRLISIVTAEQQSQPQQQQKTNNPVAGLGLIWNHPPLPQIQNCMIDNIDIAEIDQYLDNERR